MKIILVPKIGFCFGVKRAINISLDALKKKPNPCHVLGPLVHNELVTRRLKNKGIKFINSLDEAKKGTIIISAHGEYPEVFKKIKRLGYEIVNATCPLVTKVQSLARNSQKKGSQVIIIGDRNHKEVKSIQAVTEGKGIIVENEKDLVRFKIKNKPITVVVQTTQNPARVEKILKKLKIKFRKLKFYNTLCPTVQGYQKEVKKLVPKVDLMLIVGSKTSANTKRLVEIAQMSKKPVYHVENPGQLKRRWFFGIKKVGIAGGTSAPDWLIKDVIKKLKRI